MATNGVFDLFTCGVTRIDSSMSSASMRPSSSEVLPEESEPIMFTLPSELEICIRSPFPIVDHKDAELMCSELREKCNPFFLFGMFIALPPMVGEESGEDCSASVEW